MALKVYRNAINKLQKDLFLSIEWAALKFSILLIILVFGLLISSTFAQSCPLSVSNFELQSTNPTDNYFRCRGKYTVGDEICELSCTYNEPGAGNRNGFWINFEYTRKTAPIVPVANGNMCNTRFIGVVNRDDFQVLALTHNLYTAERKQAAQTLIEQMFNQLKPFAVRCPNASISPPASQSNLSERLCTSNFANLQKYELRLAETVEETKIFADSSVEWKKNKENWELMDRVLESLNIPNYNGELKETVNQFKDETALTRFRNMLGMSRSASPNAVVKKLKDIFAERVKYLSDIRSRLSYLESTIEKLENEIQTARQNLRNNQCGEEYKIKSCDLSGKWNFLVYSIDTGTNPLEHRQSDLLIWTFKPSGDKYNYKAATTANGLDGKAETFGNEMFLTWNDRSFPGYYKLTFDQNCREANGEMKIFGVEKSTKVFAKAN